MVKYDKNKYKLNDIGLSASSSNNQKFTPTLRWRSLAIVAFAFDLLMIFVYLSYKPSEETVTQTISALIFPVLAMLFSSSIILLVGEYSENGHSKLLFVCSRFERLGASFTIVCQLIFSIINGSSEEDIALTGFFSSVYLGFLIGNLMIFLVALFQKIRVCKL